MKNLIHKCEGFKEKIREYYGKCFGKCFTGITWDDSYKKWFLENDRVAIPIDKCPVCNKRLIKSKKHNPDWGKIK